MDSGFAARGTQKALLLGDPASVAPRNDQAVHMIGFMETLSESVPGEVAPSPTLLRKRGKGKIAAPSRTNRGVYFAAKP